MIKNYLINTASKIQTPKEMMEYVQKSLFLNIQHF